MPKPKKMQAVFGRSKGYYENTRMIARSRRIRKGRMLRILDPWPYDKWVGDELYGKWGMIVDDHPHYWDAVARFSGTHRQGGLFAFDYTQIAEVRTVRSLIQERKAQEREQIAQVKGYLLGVSSFARVFEQMREGLRKAAISWGRQLKQSKFTIYSQPETS